jgi:hypothetical protein
MLAESDYDFKGGMPGTQLGDSMALFQHVLSHLRNLHDLGWTVLDGLRGKVLLGYDVLCWADRHRGLYHDSHVFSSISE